MSDKIELWKRWGRNGWLIQEAGRGGGYVAIPDVLDDYERALGIEPRETWYIKRLLRNYWNAGDEVFPSIKEMTRQASISAPTIRKLRDGLTQKGLIRNVGKVGRTNGKPDSRIRIDLSPLFEALAICILCDPTSKLARAQDHALLRDAIYRAHGESDREASGRFGDSRLPMTLEEAQKWASREGISLDWNAIAKLQGAERLAKAQTDIWKYQRQVEIKIAIGRAADSAFCVRWNYKRAYNFLRWLVESDVPVSVIEEEVADYRQYYLTDARHTYQAFERRLRGSVEAWQGARIRTEEPAYV